MADKTAQRHTWRDRREAISRMLRHLDAARCNPRVSRCAVCQYSIFREPCKLPGMGERREWWHDEFSQDRDHAAVPNGGKA